MPCHYDLLVIDLDGTLLRSDGTVSARNIDAIDRAQECGVDVIIATGRSLGESREALQSLRHAGLVIAAGGSLLCDAATGATLERRPMPCDVVGEVTRWLVEHDHAALILKDAHATGYDYLVVGGGELDPASRWWFARMNAIVQRIDSLEDDPHPHDSVRAGAVACEERLAPLAARLREELGDRCCLQHWSAVTATHAIGSPTHLLEVFGSNVNKWTMTLAHCERVGVDRRRVAAIGDGLNDVELLTEAGLGIAMANAGPQAMAAARRVTAHHDEDGVALAIERLLEGEW